MEENMQLGLPKEVLAELETQQQIIRQAQIKAELKELSNDKQEKIDENSVRAVVKKLSFQNPQHIYLNERDTKRYFEPEETFELQKVTLRDRVLSVGETVILSMDIVVGISGTKEKTEKMISREAEVISAIACGTKPKSKSGLTNLVLKKLQK